jgi:DNA damage-binding protein 1
MLMRHPAGTLAPAGGNLSSNPEILFATSSGRIGVVADLNESESEILRQLQLNMENLITGPEIVWSRYREIHTEGNSKPRPAVGFIDGDL